MIVLRVTPFQLVLVAIVLRWTDTTIGVPNQATRMADTALVVVAASEMVHAVATRAMVGGMAVLRRAGGLESCILKTWLIKENNEVLEIEREWNGRLSCSRWNGRD